MTLFGKTSHSVPIEDAHAQDSWKNWFESHGPRLLLVARQCTRSLADAEDVLQEAFVRFWRHQRNLGGEPLALVVTAIRRAAVDLARRDTRRTGRELQAEGHDQNEPPLFATPAEGDERRCAIETALLRLPAEQREVLVFKIWWELTFAQIATQLGLSPNTVASRYRYALAALRQELIAADCHG